MNRIQLVDLVSRDRLQRILKVFTEVSGVGSIITYPDGSPITEPEHFTSLCLSYCRSTERGRQKCFESDCYGGMEAARLKAPFTYRCLNSGLTDCAAPLIIEGKHLATVLCGQVIQNPLSENEAVRRAQEIGIEDIDGYLKELGKVPLMSRERLLSVVNLMSEITFTISDLALQSHRVQQNSRRYLGRVINSVSDCIISTKTDDTIGMINKSGAGMFGYRREQVIGRPIDMLLADEQSKAKFMKNTGSEPSPNWRADLTAIKADSSTFPVQVSFSAFNDEHRNMAGYVGVIRDISEEKKLERMKEDLIGMITHDLRNPVLSLEKALRIVVGGALGPLEADQKKVLDLALLTSQQLYGMVSDILDIYRNENGRLVLRYTKKAVQQVVEESIKQMELLTKEKGLRLEVSVPEIPVEVNIDGERIRRTCMNLLDNAIKYSPEGGRILIRIERGEDPPGPTLRDCGDATCQDCILVSVEDEGTGIPEVYHQSIFDKYFTFKTSEHTSREGVGLGLAFCRLAVEAHGGRIWVESPVNGASKETGNGCRLSFTLPLCGEPADCPPARDAGGA
jgi:PAS domain S-box-containing protein